MVCNKVCSEVLDWHYKPCHNDKIVCSEKTVEEGELDGYMVIVTVAGPGTLSPGGLRVEILYYFGVVWSDGAHPNKNVLLRRVPSLNIFLFRNESNGSGTIGTCWRDLEKARNQPMPTRTVKRVRQGSPRKANRGSTLTYAIMRVRKFSY